jgi:hypothetical protein
VPGRDAPVRKVGMLKAKAIWLFLATAPLVRGLQWAEGRHHEEALEFLVGIMMAVGFPTSLPVLGVMFLTTTGLRSLGLEVAGTRGSFVAAWAILIVTGYLQWFVLVPRLVRWFREPGAAPHPAEPEQGAR